MDRPIGRTAHVKQPRKRSNFRWSSGDKPPALPFDHCQIQWGSRATLPDFRHWESWATPPPSWIPMTAKPRRAQATPARWKVRFFAICMYCLELLGEYCILVLDSAWLCAYEKNSFIWLFYVLRHLCLHKMLFIFIWSLYSGRLISWIIGWLLNFFRGWSYRLCIAY